jgi:hypothetical protein
MNGAVTLAPVAGETIDSVGPLLPAPEPEEAEEPPDPEEPLEGGRGTRAACGDSQQRGGSGREHERAVGSHMCSSMGFTGH